MRKLTHFAVAAMTTAIFTTGALAGTLEDTQKKGTLSCGVNTGVPGFALPDQ